MCVAYLPVCVKKERKREKEEKDGRNDGNDEMKRAGDDEA